jgi:hypothetical protein
MTERLPDGAEAILDVCKIEDYCLNPSHPRGRHKATVFREALGLERGDAGWLRDVLLDAARANEAHKVRRVSGAHIGGSTLRSRDKEKLL